MKKNRYLYGESFVVNNNALSYQWQRNTGGGWADMGGQTNDSLLEMNVNNGMNGYLYRCIGFYGSRFDTSNVATLNVISGTATINTEPDSTTVCAGGNALFGMIASNANSYLWQRNTGGGWSDMTGQNNDTLIEVGVTAGMDGYLYRCVAYGNCINDTSIIALLTINSPINITDQPSNAVVCNGGNALFGLLATGSITQYQWQYNDGNGWVDMIGQNNDTLIEVSVNTGMDGYTYRCLITGEPSCGNDTSDVVSLTIQLPATISAEPSNDSLCTGQHAHFGMLATGTITSYQWERNTGSGWTEMTGQTNDTLIEVNVTASMSGYTYRCITFSPCVNDTSNVVTLTVYNNPNITGISSSLNPNVNSIYVPKQCTNLTATTTGGTLPYTYSWSPGGSGNPLNTCPTSGTWYLATVTDFNGCQDTMSFRQYVINATSSYPGRVTMCIQSGRRWTTANVILSLVPSYLNNGFTMGACNSVPSKQGGNAFDEMEDIYKVYPNPFANELNIEFFNMFEEEVSIELTDLTGRVVKQIYKGTMYEGDFTSFKVDATDLPNGMYLVRYTSNSDMRVDKVQLMR